MLEANYILDGPEMEISETLIVQIARIDAGIAIGKVLHVDAKTPPQYADRLRNSAAGSC